MTINNEGFTDPQDYMTEEEIKKRSEEIAQEDQSDKFTNEDIILDIAQETDLGSLYRIWQNLTIALKNAVGFPPNTYSSNHSAFRTELSKVINEDPHMVVDFIDRFDTSKGKYGYNWKDHYDQIKSHKLKNNLPVDYKDVTSLSHNVLINFSPKTLIKLYYLMIDKPNIEWSAYLKYKPKLPTIDKLVRKAMNKKKETVIIEVDDLLLIPQKTGGSHVEGLEHEYPEFMKPIFDLHLDGWLTTGRIHSHNTMGSFHSPTDNGEFEKELKIQNSFFSIVVSLKERKLNKQNLDKVERTHENILEILNLMNFEVKIGKPIKDEKTNIGIIFKAEMNSFGIPKKNIKKLLVQGKEFLDEYNTMMDMIKRTTKVYQFVDKFREMGKIDTKSIRKVREAIRSNPILLDLMDNYSLAIVSTMNKNKKVLDERERLNRHVKYYIENQGYDILTKENALEFRNTKRAYDTLKRQVDREAKTKLKPLDKYDLPLIIEQLTKGKLVQGTRSSMTSGLPINTIEYQDGAAITTYDGKFKSFNAFTFEGYLKKQKAEETKTKFNYNKSKDRVISTADHELIPDKNSYKNVNGFSYYPNQNRIEYNVDFKKNKEYKQNHTCPECNTQQHFIVDKPTIGVIYAFNCLKLKVEIIKCQMEWQVTFVDKK